jgi:SAM-dependent methyltransferase
MTDQDTGYRQIIAHYEDCLDRHGDSHLGVDWPNVRDAEIRYRVMLDVIARRDAPATLLDFGCGAGHLLEFIRRSGWGAIDYRGLDASAKFVDLCRGKFPGVTFYCRDILEDSTGIEPADYVVMNGVLTERCGVSESAMLEYMETLLMAAWPLARKGMAFNVMSAQVDWKRDDLFHVPFDTMASLVKARLSRHFHFRQDYGLYEFTTYVYHEARP